MSDHLKTVGMVSALFGIMSGDDRESKVKFQKRFFETVKGGTVTMWLGCTLALHRRIIYFLSFGLDWKNIKIYSKDVFSC